jgi:proteic killer suppression protein
MSASCGIFWRGLTPARTIADMDLPGFRLHALKGFHAITVRANWRVIFRFEVDGADEVDYVDYH